MHRNFRKPLILMTPKSLLRHKLAVSTLEDMGPGSSFHRVLLDDAESKPGTSVELRPDPEIKRVVLCSGKVYYDLFEERQKRGLDNIQILRVEQFYPFPAKSLMNELSRFPEADVIWCQEEPKNMGAWTYVAPQLEATLGLWPIYAGRKPGSSPAAGSKAMHYREQKALLGKAFEI
jgi:2-oxoglutarate dehydrogenase E1 component